MKVTVTKKFIDLKANKKVRNIGDTLDISKDRVDELKGYVEKIKGVVTNEQSN